MTANDHIRDNTLPAIELPNAFERPGGLPEWVAIDATGTVWCALKGPWLLTVRFYAKHWICTAVKSAGDPGDLTSEEMPGSILEHEAAKKRAVEMADNWGAND